MHLVESAVDRGDQRVLHVAICSQRRIGCAVLSQATKSEFTKYVYFNDGLLFEFREQKQGLEHV